MSEHVKVICSYRELPRHLKWIPWSLTKGQQSIHISTITRWIPISHVTWTGTLYFRHFVGSSAIMHSSDGKDFKYNLETFSKLIPYLKDGQVSGTFHFEPYGTRMLHYVPVLPEVLLLCSA
jgi:hypothetical protein